MWALGAESGILCSLCCRLALTEHLSIDGLLEDWNFIVVFSKKYNKCSRSGIHPSPLWSQETHIYIYIILKVCQSSHLSAAHLNFWWLKTSCAFIIRFFTQNQLEVKQMVKKLSIQPIKMAINETQLNSCTLYIFLSFFLSLFTHRFTVKQLQWRGKTAKAWKEKGY